MSTFYNYATLRYGGATIQSNTVRGELEASLGIGLNAVPKVYRPGERIAFAVTLTNTGAADAPSLTLSDDLGALAAGGAARAPLTYVADSVRYFVNGELRPTPEVATDGGMLTFRGIDIPAGGNAALVYAAEVNEYAPLGPGALISNTVRLDSDATLGKNFNAQLASGANNAMGTNMSTGANNGTAGNAQINPNANMNTGANIGMGGNVQGGQFANMNAGSNNGMGGIVQGGQFASMYAGANNGMGGNAQGAQSANMSAGSNNGMSGIVQGGQFANMNAGANIGMGGNVQGGQFANMNAGANNGMGGNTQGGQFANMSAFAYSGMSSNVQGNMNTGANNGMGGSAQGGQFASMSACACNGLNASVQGNSSANMSAGANSDMSAGAQVNANKGASAGAGTNSNAQDGANGAGGVRRHGHHGPRPKVPQAQVDANAGASGGSDGNGRQVSAGVNGNGFNFGDSSLPLFAREEIHPEIEVQLSFSKRLTPQTVSAGEPLTYTLTVENRGALPLFAEDGAVITDLFDPMLEITSVRCNGVVWDESHYSYDRETGLFATLPGEIAVPAACFAQDIATGAWRLTPGMSVIEITGTLR